MISKGHNIFTASISSPIEIKKAIQDMYPLKSLRLDSFPIIFFKKIQCMIGYQVTSQIQKNLLLENYNQLESQLITLLSKVKISQNVSNYRSFNLYNASYKIIIRILVKKLRNYLKDHISSYQVDFIPIRWIVQNTLIAQEIALIISKKTREKCGIMVIKWHMRKTYLTIEYNFLMQILNCMGFSKKVYNLTDL